MGLSYDFAPRITKSMLIRYFDMQGMAENVPDKRQAEQAIEAGLVDWQCNIKPGEDLEPVSDGHSLMGRGYFILEGEGEDFLEEQAEIIKGLF